MASLQQDDFSSGIFRGRRAPKNTVYDAVNALVNDEGELFRRGGSEYKSGSDADATLLGLWDGHTAAGRRTFFWSSTSPYALDSNDSSVLDLGSVVPKPNVRGVEFNGTVYFPSSDSGGSIRTIWYGGSRKTSTYVVSGANTVTVTAGSTAVSGSGTAFLANVDAGMVLEVDGATVGIVKSVSSNTALTLVANSPVTDTSSVSADFYPIRQYTSGLSAPVSGEWFFATAGQRLLMAVDNRVYYNPLTSTTDYHELPQAVAITGAEAIQDTLLAFTTAGVWTVENLVLDDVDAFGNIQHQVRQISRDVILWGDAGISARENVLIVPAIDDVYAFALGAEPVPLTGGSLHSKNAQGIRPLYREYVEAGYKPGLATVYRGHYILPILDSSNAVQDTLVCRLDRGPAWTRWANGASGRAYARRVGATTREPKLLGLDGLRVSDLTGCFDPDSTRKDDADGTDHALTVTTSDYPLGPGLQKGHCIRVRANYSLVDAASDNPTTTMQWSRGPEGSSFTTVTATRGGGESDGTEFSSWPINKAGETIRFKWATSGAATSAVLRKIEVIFRPYGKQ